MTTTKTITLYTFDELPTEAAKQKARDWYLDVMGYDNANFAWESIAEDASRIGLKIESLSDRRANKGNFESSAIDTADKILKEHGELCEIYQTAAKFLKEMAAIPYAEDTEDYEDESETLKAQFLHDLLEDYRVMLDKEIESQASDEVVGENLCVNEYTFREDGEREGVS